MTRKVEIDGIEIDADVAMELAKKILIEESINIKKKKYTKATMISNIASTIEKRVSQERGVKVRVIK